MASRRRDAYQTTQGSLALDAREPSDYRRAAERYSAREISGPPQTQRAKEKKPRVRARSVLTVIVLLAGIFTLLIRQIDIEREIVNLHSLRTTLTEEERHGEELRLQLSLKLDVDNVQRTAKEKLNMDYADVEMTRPVSLPPIKTGSTAEFANATLQDAQEPDTLTAWLENILVNLLP